MNIADLAIALYTVADIDILCGTLLATTCKTLYNILYDYCDIRAAQYKLRHCYPSVYRLICRNVTMMSSTSWMTWQCAYTWTQNKRNTDSCYIHDVCSHTYYSTIENLCIEIYGDTIVYTMLHGDIVRCSFEGNVKLYIVTADRDRRIVYTRIDVSDTTIQYYDIDGELYPIDYWRSIPVDVVQRVVIWRKSTLQSLYVSSVHLDKAYSDNYFDRYVETTLKYIDGKKHAVCLILRSHIERNMHNYIQMRDFENRVFILYLTPWHLPMFHGAPKDIYATVSIAAMLRTDVIQ